MLRVGVREAATVPYGWKLVLGVMLRVRLRRRKGHAVDGRVGVADGAQRVRHFDAARMVDRLAEQKNRAPIFGRLLTQQVDRKGKGVENRSTAVAASLVESSNCVVHRIRVGSEVLK